MRSLLLLCLIAIAGPALAQEPVDPPGRVARLSVAEGEVSLAPAGTEEWAEAVLNRPLTSGDRVWVDSGGRAELQTGSATVHADQNTGLSFIDLDDDVMHLEITEGSVNIRVQRKRDNERILVDTPNGTVTLLHPGEYRIQANGVGDQTIVRVRSGEAEVTAGDKSWSVKSNEEGAFDGTGEIVANIDKLGPRTAFEEWANDRNRQSESSQSSRYVSNEVIGYEDLDRHGTWIHEPSYGYVWRPTYVAAGWAPYRYGRWVWVSPWGWSWVDNSPWGFAPFHYGRWAHVRSRWCWVPGPRYIRPVYAPALVAWAGSPGVSVSVGFGSGIGWFPLGPREIYVPGYRYSRRYFNNVNVSNTVIINNTYIDNIYNGRQRDFDYRYGRNSRAVTVVDRDHFVGGRSLDGRWTRVNDRDLRGWRHDPRPPALAPSRDSVFASRVLGRVPGHAQNVVRDTASQQRREGIRNGASGRNPLASRVPFDAERRAIEANGGRPVSRSELIGGRARDGSLGAAANDAARNAWRAERDQSRNPARNADRPSRDTSGAAGIAPRSGDGGSRAPRTYSDRPGWAQRQRDNAERTLDRRDDLRRQIPTQSERDDARRARESAFSNGSSMHSLRQRSDGGAAASPRERSNRESPQQWRGDSTQRERAQRESRAFESRPPSQSNSSQRSWQTQREERRPAPSYSPPPRQQAQPRTEQYRSPQPRSEPQRQPRFESGSSDRGTRSSHSSPRTESRGSGRQGFHQQQR